MIDAIKRKLGLKENNFHHKNGHLGRCEAIGRVIEDVERKEFFQGDAIKVKKYREKDILSETYKVLGPEQVFISQGWAISSKEYCHLCLQEKIRVTDGQNYCPVCDD